MEGALLNRFFNPNGIGVDHGGNGTSVVQSLLTLDAYRDCCLEDRLVGYDFGGKVEVPGPVKEEWVDEGWCRSLKNVRKLKPRWTKEYMTELITAGLTARTLIFPSSDRDIEDQFSSQTYSISENRIRYSKGNDHIVDAVRCALLVRDQKNHGVVEEHPGGVKRIEIDHVPILPLVFPPNSGY
jgi:hypothetical protein